MIVQTNLQGLDHFTETSGGGDVRGAGLGYAGRMVVRDDEAPRIEIESTAHSATQRNADFRPRAADVEVFGNVECIASEEEDHHAFLAAATQPADEVLAEGECARIGGLTQQHFPCCGFGQAPGGDDGRRHRRPSLAQFGPRFGKGVH